VGPAAGGVAARWVALLSVRVLRADVSSSRLSVCLMLALLMRRPRPAGRRSNHGCEVITTLLVDPYRIDSHCSCAYCFGRLCRVRETWQQLILSGVRTSATTHSKRHSVRACK